MDLEFSLSQKRREKEKKERVEDVVKKREDEAKRKRASIIERDRIDQITIQRKQKEAEEREVMENEKLAEEARTGGIKYCKVLNAVPISNDGNRIILPTSALESLESQSAIDPSRPLTFEVALIDDLTGETVAITHAGVSEFTADENTVGIPPKTALSLTKQGGGGLTKVRVKYVKLPMPLKSFVRLQPRGEGFHTEGSAVVSLDLKAVLERELSRHTVISKGDWLPIRHNKTSYELMVVNLEPYAALCLTSTDLEVDLLPSEVAMAEQEKRLVAEQQQAAAVIETTKFKTKLLEDASIMRTKLLTETNSEVDKDTVGAVNVLVRLPHGGQYSRRFMRTDLLQTVFEWICCQEAVVEQTAERAASAGGAEGEGGATALTSDISLSMNYPKQTFTLKDGDGKVSLSEAGLTGKREALFLQHINHEEEEAGVGGVEELSEEELPTDAMEVDEVANEGDKEEAAAGGGGGLSGSGGLSEEWASAAALQKVQLDRQLSDEDKVNVESVTGSQSDSAATTTIQATDKVAMFHMLVAEGQFDKVEAASVSQRYADELNELQNMGFFNHRLNVELLERYGGRMLRVVNALSERPQPQPVVVPKTIQDETATPALAASPASPAASGSGVQESFQTKFTELISQGIPPNEAAAQALLLLQPTPPTVAAVASTASVAVEATRWKSELKELQNMGFSELTKNVGLLEKYQGRLVRVVNALVTGDERD